MVNVAGGLLNYGPVLDLKPERLELELAVNIKTTFYVSQAAIPALRDRGGGAIVNFASAAVFKPQSQMAAYTAAKSAVAGLTRALAKELRDDGIRVNAVAPGTMKTADNHEAPRNLDRVFDLHGLSSCSQKDADWRPYLLLGARL